MLEVAPEFLEERWETIGAFIERSEHVSVLTTAVRAKFFDCKPPTLESVSEYIDSLPDDDPQLERFDTSLSRRTLVDGNFRLGEPLTKQERLLTAKEYVSVFLELTEWLSVTRADSTYPTPRYVQPSLARAKRGVFTRDTDAETLTPEMLDRLFFRHEAETIPLVQDISLDALVFALSRMWRYNQEPLSSESANLVAGGGGSLNHDTPVLRWMSRFSLMEKISFIDIGASLFSAVGDSWLAWFLLLFFTKHGSSNKRGVTSERVDSVINTILAYAESIQFDAAYPFLCAGISDMETIESCIANSVSVDVALALELSER